jgi:osmotically-inducible protein OsmY
LRDKLLAEEAARRVAGVRGIANDITVQLSAEEQRHDSQIARAAVDAITADLPLLAERIQVVVRDGHVTLDGAVEWHWQRQRIEATVREIPGVTVVSNLLEICPRVVADDIKRRIEDAFRRSAQVDAQQLTVETHDHEVILRGAVRSLHEKDEAQRTAWCAPGVTRVTNEIVVSP